MLSTCEQTISCAVTSLKCSILSLGTAYSLQNCNVQKQELTRKLQTSHNTHITCLINTHQITSVPGTNLSFGHEGSNPQIPSVPGLEQSRWFLKWCHLTTSTYTEKLFSWFHELRRLKLTKRPCRPSSIEKDALYVMICVDNHLLSLVHLQS